MTGGRYAVTWRRGGAARVGGVELMVSRSASVFLADYLCVFMVFVLISLGKWEGGLQVSKSRNQPRQLSLAATLVSRLASALRAYLQ